MARLILLVVLTPLLLACAGCGKTIFYARFDASGVADPTGEVPGDPVGDYIIQEGNGGLDFAKIAGDNLLLFQRGAGSSSGSQSFGRLNLISLEVGNAGSQRILTWKGKSTSDTGFNTPSLAVEISAQERRTALDPWPNQEIELRLGRTTAELLDAQGNALTSGLSGLHLDEEHSVYIELDLDARTIAVSINQNNGPKEVMTATIPNGTVNMLRDSSRLLARLWFPDYGASQFTGSYAMDDMRMRAK